MPALMKTWIKAEEFEEFEVWLLHEEAYRPQHLEKVVAIVCIEFFGGKILNFVVIFQIQREKLLWITRLTSTCQKSEGRRQSKSPRTDLEAQHSRQNETFESFTPDVTDRLLLVIFLILY